MAVFCVADNKRSAILARRRVMGTRFLGAPSVAAGSAAQEPAQTYLQTARVKLPLLRQVPQQRSLLPAPLT